MPKHTHSRLVAAFLVAFAVTAAASRAADKQSPFGTEMNRR
jgi:hypothetical protein